MVQGNSIFTAVGGFLGGLRQSRAWSEPLPALLPLVPLYALAFRLHRAWMLARAAPFAPRVPMIVVGSLRAGGAGKTAVTAALARRYRDLGLRVAVLAYRLGPGRRRGEPPPGHLLPVAGEGDWRAASDEAALLAGIGGIRVFATRNRVEAWRALQAGAAGEPPDLILSDDGFQDPRLAEACHLLLAAPGERPRLRDLLPAGPFREAAPARGRARIVLEGPLPAESTLDVTYAFRRRLVPPPGADRSRPWAALCGLGDNRAFAAALAAAGFPPAELLEVRDHGAVAERRLAAFARRRPGAGILCARKDWLKLGPGWAERYGIRAVDEEIAVSPEALEALDRHLASWRDARGLPAPAKLVH